MFKKSCGHLFVFGDCDLESASLLFQRTTSNPAAYDTNYEYSGGNLVDLSDQSAESRTYEHRIIGQVRASYFKTS